MVWIGYHKIFTVYYFNLSKGLGKELIGSLIAGIFLASLTIYLYWLVAIIVFAAGLILSGKMQDKNQKTTVIVIFAILAIVVFLVGRNAKEETSGTSSNEDTVTNEISYMNTYIESKTGVTQYISNAGEFLQECIISVTC